MMLKKGLLGVAITACCFLVAANEPAKPLSMRQLRVASQASETLQGIKSACIQYAVMNEGKAAKVFRLQAKRFDKVRLDIQTDDGQIACVRNGDDFWFGDKKDGVTAMNAEEKDNFQRYIELLPLPFYKTPIFGKPVFKGEDSEDGEPKLVYSVKDANKDEYDIVLDKETKDVLSISYEDENEVFNMSYSNYREIGGIRIAGQIDILLENARFVMKLVGANWNVELPDSMFDRRAYKDDAVLDNTQAPVEVPVAKVKTADQKAAARASLESKIEKLDKKIRELKIKIAANEEQAGVMAKILKVQHDDTMELTARSNKGSDRRYYWNGYCWNRSRDSSRRSSRDAKKRADEIDKAQEETFTEYKALHKKLTKQRIKLSEYELKMEKYKKQLANNQ